MKATTPSISWEARPRIKKSRIDGLSSTVPTLYMLLAGCAELPYRPYGPAWLSHHLPPSPSGNSQTFYYVVLLNINGNWPCMLNLSQVADSLEQ
jgi:hypothetical protein